VRWQASLAASEAPDTALINATSRHLVTLGVTETPDAASISGVVFTLGEIAGSLSASETRDSVGINGTVSGTTGTLAATEAPDLAALVGTVITTSTIFGVLTATEARDTARIVGQLELLEAPIDVVGPMSFGRKQRYLLGPWQVPVRW